MPNYTYLIIGGGMTADAAIGGIREVDPSGSVGLIGADSHPPYDRPPLSKGLWKGKPLESIWRKTDRQGVTLHLGRQARTLVPHDKRVTTIRGQSMPSISYYLPPAAHRAGCPSAEMTSSTIAPWTITSGCGR